MATEEDLASSRSFWLPPSRTSRAKATKRTMRNGAKLLQQLQLVYEQNSLQATIFTTFLSSEVGSNL